MPAAESERVGFLLSLARRIEGQISEELDSAQLLRERLQALQRGLNRVRKLHKRQAVILDQCEGCENQGSDSVAAAVERCLVVGEELTLIWQDIMGLRQLLHTLPTSLRVSVSPVGVERDISGLQDCHDTLESRCARLLSLMKNRLALWRRFERQLEMVQQSVQEADYMMELLTVQGSVDYERLLKATERLEVSLSWVCFYLYFAYFILVLDWIHFLLNVRKGFSVIYVLNVLNVFNVEF